MKNMREMLGGAGRTISNMDRTIAASMGPAMGSPMYDDNEPRFETRSPENETINISTSTWPSLAPDRS